MKIYPLFSAAASCVAVGLLCACSLPTGTITSVDSFPDKVNPSQFSEVLTAGFASDYLYGNDLESLRVHSDKVVEGTVASLSYVTEGSLAFTIADIEINDQLKGDDTLAKGDHVSVLYSGGYIPLRDLLSEDDGVSEIYRNWPDSKIDSTVVFQKAVDEGTPSIGDHAVFFLMKETKFPQWGDNLYALICGANAELLSADNGRTFEYKEIGNTGPIRSYSSEVIESALDNDVSFEKAQRKTELEEKQKSTVSSQ